MTTATEQRLEQLEREVRAGDPDPKAAPTELVLGGPVAPAWQRAAALWLDLGTVLGVSAALLAALWTFGRDDVARWLGGPLDLGALGVAIAGAVYALHALAEGLWDTTPGKRVVGLAVRTYEGTRVPWPRALGRGAVKALGPLLLALAPIVGGPRLTDLGLAVLVLLACGGLLALGPEGAALHDRVFRTRVRLTHVLVRV